MFKDRSLQATHPMAKKLFAIMEEKKSNLALACDVTSQKELLYIADTLGEDLCVLKTHVDLLEDFTPDFGDKLRQISEKRNFLIFEDRKFADIGQTVTLQYEKGIYKIAEWADLINAHLIPGPGIIEGLKLVGKPKGQGLLLLAEMSSRGTTAKGSYTKKVVAEGERHSDFVCGFISLGKVSNQPGMIHFTPGVRFEKGKDSLGQRYRTAEEILVKGQSDVIIVGRDILKSQNPKETASLYRQRGWELYLARIDS